MYTVKYSMQLRQLYQHFKQKIINLCGACSMAMMASWDSDNGGEILQKTLNTKNTN